MNAVQMQRATVFRVTNGRRYFTLKAACKHVANGIMKVKHPCTCDPATGYTCDVHGGWISERDEIAEQLMTEYKNKFNL